VGTQRVRLIWEAKDYFIFLVFYTALVLSNRAGIEGVLVLTGAREVNNALNVDVAYSITHL